MNFTQLRGRHAGETCWIVGKGPSLGHLRAEHFGAGPVIALNQAIMIVEALGLSNTIYSLQKDGCGIKGPHAECAKRDGVDWMIRPQKATLILQDVPGYSRDCLRDYERRVLVNPVTHLRFRFQETMAVRMSIALAKIMGCKKLVVMCCNSLVNGNTQTYNVYTGKAEQTSAGNHYLPSRKKIVRELRSIRHTFVLPSTREVEHG